METSILKSEYTALVTHYQRIIYKVCYVYTNNNEELGDYFQEVLIALWKSYPKFRGDSNISTWIYRISLNTCISYLRKNKRHGDTISLSPDLDLYADDMEQNDGLKALYFYISQLNKLEKALILLWLEERSYEEMAEIMGLSKDNVGMN